MCMLWRQFENEIEFVQAFLLFSPVCIFSFLSLSFFPVCPPSSLYFLDISLSFPPSLTSLPACYLSLSSLSTVLILSLSFCQSLPQCLSFIPSQLCPSSFILSPFISLFSCFFPLPTLCLCFYPSFSNPPLTYKK